MSTCDVVDCDQQAVYCEAHARAMVVVPELCDALAMVLDAMDEHGADMPMQLVPYALKARAALAKAKL
jgi:hypothetical protein